MAHQRNKNGNCRQIVPRAVLPIFQAADLQIKQEAVCCIKRETVDRTVPKAVLLTCQAADLPIKQEAV